MPVYYRGYKITYIPHYVVFATTLKNTSFISTKRNPKKVYGMSYKAIKRSIREDIFMGNPNKIIRMACKPIKDAIRGYNFNKKGGKI